MYYYNKSLGNHSLKGLYINFHISMFSSYHWSSIDYVTLGKDPSFGACFSMD
jgi:hypothetical protein